MIVELDLFSGRPNPRWKVEEAVRLDLLGLEARLKPAAGPHAAPPGLGYRGFVYADRGATRRAFGGRIEQAGRVLDDPGRTIERRLLASMPAEFAPLRERLAGLLD